MITESEKRRIFLQFSSFAKKHQEEYPNGWFEGVITVDGKVLAADISHIYTLIQLSGKSEHEIWKEMPVTTAPLLWLSDYVKAIPVYNAGYLDAPMNDSQRYALSLLVNRKMVNDQKLYI